MNTAGRTPPLCTAPSQATSIRAVPICRAVIVSLLLTVGVSLAGPRVAQAGLADWWSAPAGTMPAKSKAKKPAKKAGMFQNNTKKPTSATGRMMDSLVSGPNKMMKSSMSALLPGKPTTSTSKSRTVPRKMVSDQKQPSMLGRLFTPQKPTDQTQTVTEWMAQPRPKP